MSEQKPKIMVVDDEPRMLSTVTVILEDAGYEVYGVEDGYKAVELASQKNFALVFMDISLPGMDGVETFRKIRSVSPGTPVIMMTGFSVEDLLSKALEEGAYTVLYKPFDVSSLLVAVDEMLDAPCVLVFDEESDDRQSITMVVEDLGYKTVEALDYKEAVVHVQSKNYDLIFMNSANPAIEGFDSCREILNSNSSVKVIFISKYDVNSYTRQALQAGAFSMVGKPVEPADMFALVGSVAGAA